ncbi:hypothetical protein CYMTET_48145 [Cymbomonas tetramitiformis]|uniref:Uncharacterized protein n=1 Tax=Cymbomonas tetramitiformis TaxID=36881 RepID=A0AAE0BUK6_9CHLO|nr:hypothetical protein CYMTET_48145 [Cymbomonas tetramitiformis]
MSVVHAGTRRVSPLASAAVTDVVVTTDRWLPLHDGRRRRECGGSAGGWDLGVGGDGFGRGGDVGGGEEGRWGREVVARAMEAAVGMAGGWRTL